MDYVRAFGSILGAVKLEQWRGRTVATVTEVLPESKAAGWQSRTLDFYSGEAHRGDPLTLWEVPLAPPRESLAHPPALALSLRGDFLELRAGLRNGTGAGHGANRAEDQETVFFRVPLDAARLAEFRSADPVSNGNGGSLNGNSWQSFYSHEDSDLGIDWQLRLRDLQRQSEWEQWKILEPAQMDETAAQGECGLTGSPAQTFSNPSISRSTA